MNYLQVFNILAALLLLSPSPGASQTTVSSDGPFREAFFNGSSHINMLLPHPLSLRGHIGLSFRSCVGGPLFSQQARPGVPGLALEARAEGLVLTITSEHRGRQETLLANPRLLDNRWHTVEIVERLGVVTLSSPGQGEVTVRGEVQAPEDSAATVVVLGGSGFVGCILEGPSLLLRSAGIHRTGVNVQWGPCPLNHSSCQVTDHCYNEPCMRHGTCVSRADRNDYECHCAARYSGKNCDKDNGPPCTRDGESPCKNNGQCSEDNAGNYECLCEPGFSGKHCDIETKGPQACTDSPCLNNGTCRVLAGGGQECMCPLGYSGVRCETNVDECASNPCLNDGVCEDGINGYKCKCSKTGYEGLHCEVNVDECLNAPCLNRGTCFDTYGGYVCQCATGFGGQNCELNLDECSSSPCLHDGECRDLLGGYDCLCLPGYSGANCERSMTSTPDLATEACGGCPPNSMCVENPGMTGPSHICVCLPGFVGSPPNCSVGPEGKLTHPSPCSSAPCAHGGDCLETGAFSFNCSCAPGYSGTLCQLSVDECLSNPCMNGGSCIDRVDGYICNCTEHFMGERCELEYDACASLPCQNEGKCEKAQKSREGFYCECKSGFEGLTCENNINDCLRVTCPDERICVDLVGGYECRCRPGFTGDNCTIDIDHCEEKPCHNNGTCKDGVGNYTCICQPGYTGRNCESDVNECDLFEKLCKNGICINNQGSYECFCRPGFSGNHCDLDFDECLSRPCLNGAECVNQINGFNCLCTPGYAGKDCSLNINECESDPCMHGSTCIDEVAAFSCACPPGITGRLCETNIDDCQSSPCENGGFCVDGINSYECNCTGTGYEGDHCQHNIDDCLPQPCQNDGQCVDLINDYKCDCYAAYTGKDCETDILECESSPCQYGGTCLELSDQSLYVNDSSPYRELLPEVFSHQNAAGFVCACVDGIAGDRCDINIDECQSSPCQHGVCKDGIASYRCDCEKGYEGIHCELDVDECAPQPCDHGQCINLRADYRCDCEADWGGRNCSVALLGCHENTCHNNGTCKPWLQGETEHRFNCTCPKGFHGKTCRRSSTLSFAGPSSFVAINTSREEGYDISFRFKTTLSNGLLVNGQGSNTLYLLELVGGRLNLHTNLLNKYDGAFIGSNLNDSEWKNVFVSINSSHLVLSATDEQSIYPINPEFVEGSLGVDRFNPTSFPITNLGGKESLFRKSQSFVGCMEDVVVNGKWLLPVEEGFESGMDTEDQGDVAHAQMSGIEAGCPRTEQCKPNPCHSGGVCTDLWRDFKCACERPFLGHTCQYNMTAATFGHENSTDGYVTVRVADEAQRALRQVASVSMFIRTRKAQGAIFHLGPVLGGYTEAADDTVIAAQLEGGELLVKIQFNATPESYSVGGTRLDDGNSHLIQVVRNVTLVEVRINGTEYFKKTISSAGPLSAHVLYLGGMPSRPRPSTSQPSTPSQPLGVTSELLMDTPGVTHPAMLRARRQAGIISAAATPTVLNTIGLDGLPVLSPVPSAVTGRPENYYSDVNFKGVIQDVQISNGSHAMAVQFYPLQATDVDVPPSLGDVSFSPNSVFEGVVSDDSCVSQPCLHDGKCVVTWNDFVCECPAGYKGKDCNEMEFCQLQDCPSGSDCVNLDEGYECVANATFDGSVWPSPLVYSVRTHEEDSTWWGIPELKVTFRTKSGGTLVLISFDNDHLRLSILNDGTVFVDYTINGQSANTKINTVLNGDWMTTVLKLDDSSLPMINLDPLLTTSNIRRDPLSRPPVSMTSWKRLLRKGTVTIAGTEGGISHDGNDVDDHNIIQPIKHSLPYKGCLGEIRVSGILVPFFSAQQLNASNNVTSRHFLTDSTLPHIPGCELCFNNDCQNGGMCRDPVQFYECTCPAGYQGDACEENIDECLGSLCSNNSSCVDGVGNYTCLCQPGFEGWLCDSEIDECLSAPCLNNGTCHDQLAAFYCECPDEWVGDRCENLRRVTCENQPCHNQAKCADVPNPHTNDNFTCSCTPGYDEPYCEHAFCEATPCQNGARCDKSAQPMCLCPPGYEGLLCEDEIDECLSTPCHHGGLCVDQLAGFSCQCTGTGYEGPTCDHDIDECDEARRAGIEPCGAGLCHNLMGSFQCVCANNSFCGLTCSEPNPCLLTPCQNGATCQPVCIIEQNYTCECPPGFQGHDCQLPLEGGAARDDDGLNLALIITPIVCLFVLIAAVGIAVFISLARKKRATRGTYSPSQQEYCNPRVELDNVLKPPPEERLI